MDKPIEKHPSARIAFSRHLAHLYEEHGKRDYLMGEVLGAPDMKKRALGWFNKYLETLGERGDDHRELVTMLQVQLQQEVSG